MPCPFPMPGAKRRRSGRFPTICNGFMFVHFLHFFVLEGSAINGPNLKRVLRVDPKFTGRPTPTRWLPTLCGGFVCVSYHFFVVFGCLSFL